MIKFIEVTALMKDTVTGKQFEQEILLNTYDIIGILKSDQGTTLEIREKEGAKAMFITETYEDIKSMLIKDIISQDIGDL